jgi:hypothetical protein
MFQDHGSIENSGIKAKAVWLEPWATGYTIAPGEGLVVVGASEHNGQFEVVDYGDKVGVYGWPGSSYQVLKDGKLIGEDISFTPDGPPSGMSIREFIEGAFGGPGGTAD